MTKILIGDEDGMREVEITGGIEINSKTEPCSHRVRLTGVTLGVRGGFLEVGERCYDCGKQRVTSRMKIELVEGGVWE